MKYSVYFEADTRFLVEVEADSEEEAIETVVDLKFDSDQYTLAEFLRVNESWIQPKGYAKNLPHHKGLF